MKKGKQSRIVLVTCGTPVEARRIGLAVVSKRLAACVNFMQSPVESIYWWKGAVEKAREYLLVIKTTKKLLAELEKEVLRLHSYDVPEFIAVHITEASSKYLLWLEECVRQPRKNRK